MITPSIVRQDDVIYWKRIGVNETGEPIFDSPVIIKAHWDQLRKDQNRTDGRETVTYSNNVTPDRVLVIGSMLMLGGHETLHSLSQEEIKDPRLLREARVVKNQSVTFELGWKQVYYPDFQSEHVVIDVQL